MNIFFDTIVIESDRTARDRLKTAATGVPEFHKIIPSQSFEDCSSHYSQDRFAHWDVAFVTNRQGTDRAISFINEARTYHCFRETAFILCVRASDLTDTGIASSIAKGVDGILCEPYSVEGLRDCTKIAIAVKMNNGKQRVKIALGVLVPLIMKNIAAQSTHMADVALNRALEIGDPAIKAEIRHIEETCKTIKEIAECSERSYESIIQDVFGSFEAEAEERRGFYKGASKRLLYKFEAELRLVKDLKAHLLRFGTIDA